ncbi:MAG TPA: hypothetical protein VFZ16_17730 [Hyphomicrobiaceae bacterium]|nr:hypothetical protein [Hyphomicrobiaceae bacterium]
MAELATSPPVETDHGAGFAAIAGGSLASALSCVLLTFGNAIAPDWRKVRLPVFIHRPVKRRHALVTWARLNL